MSEPKTCRFCNISTSCKRRQKVHFAVFDLDMYKATQEQIDKLESLLAETCQKEREEVYHVQAPRSNKQANSVAASERHVDA